jgi:hypothetical protein
MTGCCQCSIMKRLTELLTEARSRVPQVTPRQLQDRLAA